MSMGLALEGARDFLRQETGWSANQCGIQHQGIPPATAGDFYVAVDDNGVETGREVNNELREIVGLEISIWRRERDMPQDMSGLSFLDQHRYKVAATTLENMERLVIKTLHHNWSFRVFINDRFALPSDAVGDVFLGSLTYRGRGRNETVGLPESNDATMFIGRRLRFRGLHRTQKIGSMG